MNIINIENDIDMMFGDPIINKVIRETPFWSGKKYMQLSDIGLIQELRMFTMGIFCKQDTKD